MHNDPTDIGTLQRLLAKLNQFSQKHRITLEIAEKGKKITAEGWGLAALVIIAIVFSGYAM